MDQIIDVWKRPGYLAPPEFRREGETGEVWEVVFERADGYVYSERWSVCPPGWEGKVR